MRPRRLGGIVLLVPFAVFAVAAGCTALTDTTTSDTSTTEGAPIVEIDPAGFLGDVLCADVPGAMRSYVVTFVDLGPETDDGSTAPGYPVALPSSEPTPCSQRVAFTNGVVGHRYVAEIDGYEEDATTLAAACSQKPDYGQCIANVVVGAIGNALCQNDADCKTTTGCQGKCKEAQLEVEAADGTCQPVKDGGNVKACVFESCSASKLKCVGSPKAKAPLGAGACVKDADCFALGCYGQCKKEPLQVLQAADGTCKTVLGDDNQAMQAGVCIYTPVIGDRHMVKHGTATAVSPRWQTPATEPCGWVNQVTAQAYQRISIGPCAPLVDSGGTSATGIRVIPSATLDSLACLTATDGGTTGTVTAFDVEPADAALTPSTNIACSSTDGTLYEQGVVGGKEYVFTVKAYEDGQAAPTRQAKCFATAHAGVIVLAKCDPLVAIAP
jgi:hypothetical protein